MLRFCVLWYTGNLLSWQRSNHCSSILFFFQFKPHASQNNYFQSLQSISLVMTTKWTNAIYLRLMATLQMFYLLTSLTARTYTTAHKTQPLELLVHVWTTLVHHTALNTPDSLHSDVVPHYLKSSLQRKTLSVCAKKLTDSQFNLPHRKHNKTNKN